MKKCILLITCMISMLAPMGISVKPTQATSTRKLIITMLQLRDYLFFHPLSTSYIAYPVALRYLDIRGSKLLLRYDLRNNNKLYTYTIDIQPTLTNGRITCTLDRAFLKIDFVKVAELTQEQYPDLDAQHYCDSLLNPFISVHGSAITITKMELKERSFFLELSGNLVNDALHPVIIAGCNKVKFKYDYDIVNVRSAPSYDAPIIGLWDDRLYKSGLLGWEGNWFKINYKGVIGWVSQQYTLADSMTGNCSARMANIHHVWEYSQSSSDYAPRLPWERE